MKQQRNTYSMVTPETWELIRAAYLSGQSATVVAARFGTTVDAIRKRAGREGWTKLAYARAKAANGEGPEPPERDPNAESKARVKPFGCGGSPARAAPPEGPPPEPREVLKAALGTAGRMLMEGRGAEAQAMVRAAEGLVRLNALAAQQAASEAPLPTVGQIFLESEAGREEEWRRVEQLARQLLGEGVLPAGHTPDAFRWRAEHLGPQTAEADRERARRGGWYDRVFNPDGSVISHEQQRARGLEQFADILAPQDRAELWREVEGWPGAGEPTAEPGR